MILVMLTISIPFNNPKINSGNNNTSDDNNDCNDSNNSLYK